MNGPPRSLRALPPDERVAVAGVADATDLRSRDVAGRIEALDFTKGALVLAMVLYHWLNYFVSTEGDFYRYLRFLTPSFIFITGFLISHVYLSPGRAADPHIAWRLFTRGVKLLAVFFVINAARALLLSDVRGAAASGLSPYAFVPALVTGNVSAGDDMRATAFNILVPIAYLLMLAAPLARVARRFRHVFHAACAGAFAAIPLLRSFDLEFGNLELLAMGFLGAVVGYVPIERIRGWTGHTYVLAAAYVAYLGVITARHVTFSLQIFGVLLSLMILFRLGDDEVLADRVQKCVVLLGRYSLFGYIAQIAVLQALYRLLRSHDPGAPALFGSFVAAFTLTIGAVYILDFARTRLATVDRLYKAVFA
jgi:peptidoglycan/LPS O-acetylase OafA/YrhL